MSIPKYFEIHKPLLQFLNDGSAHTKKAAKTYLANYFVLSDSELNELLPSGRQKVFDNRIESSLVLCAAIVSQKLKMRGRSTGFVQM